MAAAISIGLQFWPSTTSRLPHPAIPTIGIGSRFRWVEFIANESADTIVKNSNATFVLHGPVAD